ncbi:MAG TPA: NCS2 family permease [Gemmataceae bacterium]|nr:NCS2 family permease [Gemmataceae bacterium]
MPNDKPGFLDRWFGIRERGSSLRVEVLGGITTFATMAYIIVVNPAILANAQIDTQASTIATILASVFGCLLMGLYANRPIAVAPYMGENAFIATLAIVNITWQQRLGSVFLAGAIFLILTLFRARTWLAAAISPCMKHAFAIGIGLFLLFIGMVETRIVVHGFPDPAPPVRIGDFHEVKVQLALAGFALIAALMYWNARGAILIGIAVIAAAGYLLGVADAPTGVVAWPGDYGLEKVALQLDILGTLRFDFLTVLLTLFLISFLDTVGTIYALGSAAGMLDGKGNLVDVERPMIVDSIACMFSALIGTSTSGAYIESAAGIREGARTGLAAVVTGLCFTVALFFVPLFEPLQSLKFAYGPAMMIVGVMMFSAVRHLDANDLTELAPAVVTIVMMVFTYNIANGLTAGLILHPVLKFLCGKWRQIHPGGVILAVLCAVYYVFGRLH